MILLNSSSLKAQFFCAGAERGSSVAQPHRVAQFGTVMVRGRSRSSVWTGWRPLAYGWPGLGLLLLAGCALGQPHLDHVLLADRGAGVRNEGVAECYLVHCPDVLAIQVSDRPDFTGPHPVGPDGRIDLDGQGRLRVEGRTVPEIGRLVAREIGRPQEQVQVRVAAFNSQQVYLFGQGISNEDVGCAVNG